MTVQFHAASWLDWVKLGLSAATVLGGAVTAWVVLNGNVSQTADKVSGVERQLSALTVSIGAMREDVAALRATAPVRAAAVDHRLDEVERRVARLEDARRRVERSVAPCAAADCADAADSRAEARILGANP
jgi:hypothetical protein